MFKAVLLGAVAMVAVVALGSLGLYVSGRIILPDMGLTPPGYDKYFWATAMATLIMSPIYFVKAALNS